MKMTIEEQQKIQELLDRNLGISRIPLKYERDTRFDLVDIHLKHLEAMLAFVGVLGEIEHTGDWDPYLDIELVDGGQYQTESGYYDIEVLEREKEVVFYTYDEAADKDDKFILAFDVIKTIELVYQ